MPDDSKMPIFSAVERDSLMSLTDSSSSKSIPERENCFQKKTFTDTEPLVQEFVNERIISNMSAFLRLNGSSINQCSRNMYPTSVPSVSVNPTLDSIINDIDPFLKKKQCVSIYDKNKKASVNLIAEQGEEPSKRCISSNETLTNQVSLEKKQFENKRLPLMSLETKNELVNGDHSVPRFFKCTNTFDNGFTDLSQENTDKVQKTLSQRNTFGTENLSEKFRKIRTFLPNASVSECLDGLRYSNHDPEKAINYIQAYKLTQLNFGYSFSHCEQVFKMNHFDFHSARCALTVQYVAEHFNGLKQNVVLETLKKNGWNVKTALTEIFLEQCSLFGVERQQGLHILKGCNDNVTKAEEIAKILRVAEVTGKSESHCLSVLSKLNWKVGEAVECILSKS